MLIGYKRGGEYFFNSILLVSLRTLSGLQFFIFKEHFLAVLCDFPQKRSYAVNQLYITFKSI